MVIKPLKGCDNKKNCPINLEIYTRVQKRVRERPCEGTQRRGGWGGFKEMLTCGHNGGGGGCILLHHTGNDTPLFSCFFFIFSTDRVSSPSSHHQTPPLHPPPAPTLPGRAARGDQLHISSWNLCSADVGSFPAGDVLIAGGGRTEL